MKAIQVLLATLGNIADKLLWRDTGFFCRNHDRCTVRIVGANEVHFIARHSLKPDPDVSLDIFHDVADMEWCIGIGEGGGNEQLAAHNQYFVEEKNVFYQRRRIKRSRGRMWQGGGRRFATAPGMAGQRVPARFGRMVLYFETIAAPEMQESKQESKYVLPGILR